MTAIARMLAVAIAIAGAIDPSWTVTRTQPASVSIRTPPSDGAAESVAREVRSSLAGAIDERSDADSVIAIDHVPEPVGGDGTSLSTVLPAPPNIRVAGVDAPPRSLPGQAVRITARLDGAGVSPRTSTLIVERDGVELARAEHAWKADGAAQVSISFVPVAIGDHIVQIRSLPFDGESRADDNAAPVLVRVASDPLRVFVYEPRPSWTVGFVRRALESDPAFAVSSMTRHSRDVVARAGEPPPALVASRLQPFDAVIVGALDELRPADVEVLRAYARERGGAVILAPDRKPEGAVGTLLAGRGVEEVLVQAPLAIGDLKASELALLREPGPDVTPLAGTPQGRAVVAWWPLGNGRVIFSGALDAWRSRADGDAFARFWRRTVAAAALASPPAVAVAVDAPRVRPGARVAVTARLRDPDEAPWITAEAISANGARESIRLWPAPEAGLFEGSFEPRAEGRYDIRVVAGDITADTILDVHASAPPSYPPSSTLRTLASITGGVSTSASDLEPLVSHIRNLPRAQTTATIHPMRSPWWILPFAAALAFEWAARRRRGLR